MTSVPLPRERRSIGKILGDALLLIIGSVIFAVGLDCFEVPNGLAAGGLTGLATIIYALGEQAGLYLPVGVQNIVMNIVLLTVVLVQTHDRGYVMRSLVGIVVSGLAVDLLAPVLPSLGQGDLLLSAFWGGALVGVGVGLVFRAGYNTGGTDIICQMISKRTGTPLGTITIIVDAVIVAASVPVFSIRNALYATVAMLLCGRVIDMVLDGPRSERAAYIISDKHAEIAKLIMYDLGRGCTELQARGVWSGNSRPVLLCVLGRSETVRLKDIVAQVDPEAIVIISEVHEAFGQGFGRLGS